MGESKGHYFKTEQLEAVEDMVERNDAASEGEAVDLFVNEGMRQYGYRVGGNGDTWLKRLAGELARLFAYLGVGWLAFFALFPVQFRMIGVAIVALAVAMTALRLVLGQVEPRVTHALQRGEHEA
jgi:hypothetical protein